MMEFGNKKVLSVKDYWNREDVILNFETPLIFF